MAIELQLVEQESRIAGNRAPSGSGPLVAVGRHGPTSASVRPLSLPAPMTRPQAVSSRAGKILANQVVVRLASWGNAYELLLGCRSAISHLAAYAIIMGGLLMLALEVPGEPEALFRRSAYVAVAVVLTAAFWRFRRKWEGCSAKLRAHVVATLASLAGLTILHEIAQPGPTGWLLASFVLVLGALALVRAPAAAAQFVILVSAGWLLLTETAAWLPALLVVLAAANVHRFAWRQAQLFERSAGQAREMEERALTAEAVIKSIEETGNNWLWKVDADRRLTYASPRFALLLEQDIDDLLGGDLISILRCRVRSDEQHSAFRTLEFHVATRLSFEEIVLAVDVNGSERWLSIAGAALSDERGQFIGYSGVGADLTAARKAEDHARQLALFDNLTGLPNRAHFRSILNELLARSLEKDSTCTLMFIDLDRFKVVNDTLGHPVGDELLRQVARRIDNVVKGSGQAGRLGGDEFVVVFPSSPSRSVSGAMASRLIAEVSAPYHIEGSQIQIGASVGLATGPDDGCKSEDLIRHADFALYAAKQEGRGTHRFYDRAMGESAEFRRSLELDLQQALANGELRLLYQPFFDIKKNTLAGFEALLRWRHPSRGDISPEQFISVAEESGLITRLGEWVLRTALAEAAGWPEHIGIAINLSPLQLQDAGFSALMMSALSRSQVKPARVELEITESVFLQETPTTKQNLDHLRRMGLKLALDDFGTGYSSLGYLRKASFSKIKIDRSFVEDIERCSGGNASIVRAIVALAESLGMSTTAEGAETPEQIEALRSIGCSHVQGFAYGSPMTHSEACALVAKSGAGEVGSILAPRERRLGMLRSVVVRSGEVQCLGILRNVSSGGAMLEMDQRLALGSKVGLFLHPRHCTPGVVRWVAHKRIGVMFDQPVKLEQIKSFGM